MMMVLMSMLALVTSAEPTAVRSTWDEPWHEVVVRDADALVKVRVLENDDGRSLTLRRLAVVAGADLPPVFVVDGFCKLRFISYSSGSGPRFHHDVGAEYYLFIQRSQDLLSWEIATPAAGTARVTFSDVRATYRISIEKAVVDEETYVWTQRAIYDHLHGRKVDQEPIEALFDVVLRESPATLTDDVNDGSSRRFFRQHVALELFYYFGTPARRHLLAPFLRAPEMHAQVSAVRALSRIDDDRTLATLLSVLDGVHHARAKVAAVDALRRLDARELLPELRERALEASTAAGFGLAIMDPRIGTSFPASVQAALEGLIEEWSE